MPALLPTIIHITLFAAAWIGFVEGIGDVANVFIAFVWCLFALVLLTVFTEAKSSRDAIKSSSLLAYFCAFIRAAIGLILLWHGAIATGTLWLITWFLFVAWRRGLDVDSPTPDQSE